MKLGIITSSVSDLYLLHILREYDFSACVRYDQEGGDRGDKNDDYVEARIEVGLQSLIECGVEHIILPPMRELYYRTHQRYGAYIVPLFYQFMTMIALPGSRVGKIGFLGEYSDNRRQHLLRDVCAGHTKSHLQTLTKKFHSPIALWCQQVTLRKHFLRTLGARNRMVHNVVKHDLHYLLDAGVDTVIPLQYGYFAYEVTIAKMFRTKKCRFHRSGVLAQLFGEYINSKKSPHDAPSPHLSSTVHDAKQYSITVMYTGTHEHLLHQKKWMWILQRGKAVQVERKHVTV